MANAVHAIRLKVGKRNVRASPDQRAGKPLAIEEVFALAAARVDRDLADQPLVRAELGSHEDGAIGENVAAP